MTEQKKAIQNSQRFWNNVERIICKYKSSHGIGSKVSINNLRGKFSQISVQYYSLYYKYTTIMSDANTIICYVIIQSIKRVWHNALQNRTRNKASYEQNPKKQSLKIKPSYPPPKPHSKNISMDIINSIGTKISLWRTNSSHLTHSN